MDDARNQMILRELVRRSNDEGRRLRDVENRLIALEERVNSIESSVALFGRRNSERASDVEAKLKVIDDDLIKLKNVIERISRQWDKVATRRELKEMERMLDLLSPLRQEFVTRDELALRAAE